MSFVRNAVRALADSPIGQILRRNLGIKPPLAVRPLSPEYSVSDLFPWRVDDTWDTRFDLTNVPSMIFPDRAPHDRVTLVAFALDGRELARKIYDLQPFEVRSVLLRDIVGDAAGPAGTFAVFHDPGTAMADVRAAGCNIAERGYLSFKRKTDTIWGVVHGNLHALCKHPSSASIGHVAGRLNQPATYRVQTRFDDTDYFELTFANASSKTQSVTLRLLDDQRQQIGHQEQTINPHGLGLFAVHNSDRKIAMVEASGAIAMWRPAMFKYYPTHFNVLHS